MTAAAGFLPGRFGLKLTLTLLCLCLALLEFTHLLVAFALDTALRCLSPFQLTPRLGFEFGMTLTLALQQAVAQAELALLLGFPLAVLLREQLLAALDWFRRGVGSSVGLWSRRTRRK